MTPDLQQLLNMAALPSPEQVAGPYVPQYEVYWKKLDPNGTGKVAPLEAAQFLKNSGLSDQTLGKVWDLSDPEGNGFLDKAGLFTACKLVALSQANREIIIDSILDECPAPNFGAETAPGAPVAAAPRGTPAPSINFLVKPEEKRKYDALFDQLKPQDGKLPGDRVRNVMIGSKLPMSMLGKIWDLSDQDKDGFLDRYEFTVSMHLVYRALQGDMIPDQLPQELSEQKVPAPLSAAPVLPELRNGIGGGGPVAVARSTPSLNDHQPFQVEFPPSLHQPFPVEPAAPHLLGSTDPLSSPLTPLQPVPPPRPPSVPLTPLQDTGDPAGMSSVQAIPWVVNAGDRLRYEALFKQTDSDKDGFVSGVEIKNVFLQTGLPQNILAHIWNLCDMKQEGKLNPEQFALAMYLVQQKQAGKDPPAALTPDMVPPTMRPKPVGGADGGSGGGEGGGARSVYNNPELEQMAREIQELLQEKMALEREVQEADYNISVKNTETHSLRSEFDTLNATLTQLTNQKNIAQKRLDDLDGQKSSLALDLHQLESRIEAECDQINKLRDQADDQESNLVAQEEEVNSKKRELEVLVQEETNSMAELKKSQREIEALMKTAADIEYLLSETKSKLVDMEEAETHMKDAAVKFELAMAPDAAEEASNVPDMYLEPLRLSFSDPDFSKLDKPSRPPLPEPAVSPMVNGRVSAGSGEGFSDNVSPVVENPKTLFNNDDAFATFTANPETVAFDPFGSFGSSGFGSASSSAFPTPTSFPPFKPDPYDPFGSAASFMPKFDASPASRGDTPPALAPRPGESDSPTPALPPKNKAPPPKRPPPPRRPPPPKSGPAHPEPPRPPPPATAMSPLVSPPAEDDPFGGKDAFASTNATKTASGAGGFADFSNFAAFEDNSQLPGLSQPTQTLDTPADNNTFSAGLSFNNNRWRNSHAESTTDESAFGSKTHTPQQATPTVETKGLDFFEDPFKNSNYRYGDPFDISTSDPFSNKDDPFAAPDSAVFGADPFSEKADPFGGSADTVAVKSSTEPFADPFGVKPAGSNNTGADPFSGAFGLNHSAKIDSFASSSDPFGSSFATSFGSDPFGGPNNNVNSSGGSDPFSLTNLNALKPPSDINSNQSKSGLSATSSTVTYRKESKSSVDGAVGEKTPKNKKSGHHFLPDLLSGSPLKTEKTPKEKKEKKSGSKFNLASPLKSKSKNSPKSEKKSSKTAGPTGEAAVDDIQLKMAAEVNKRAEDDRMRRLRMQEEQDLAYAIALSKAEAASLKSQ